jgi:uncharacterized damage-inducible protein DinB
MSATPLADAWRVNCRHTIFLLDNLTQEQLGLRRNARSKTVLSQFRHLAVIRKTWLEVTEPATGKSVTVPETDDSALIKSLLNETGEALAQVIEAAEATGKLKGYKTGPAMFLAYACAHEAHHRGQILLYLKNGDLPFDKLKSYKLWEWK